MFETMTLWLIDMLFTHITGVTVIAYVHNMSSGCAMYNWSL